MGWVDVDKRPAREHNQVHDVVVQPHRLDSLWVFCEAGQFIRDLRTEVAQ